MFFNPSLWALDMLKVLQDCLEAVFASCILQLVWVC